MKKTLITLIVLVSVLGTKAQEIQDTIQFDHNNFALFNKQEVQKLISIEQIVVDRTGDFIMILYKGNTYYGIKIARLQQMLEKQPTIELNMLYEYNPYDYTYITCKRKLKGNILW